MSNEERNPQRSRRPSKPRPRPNDGGIDEIDDLLALDGEAMPPSSDRDALPTLHDSEPRLAAATAVADSEPTIQISVPRGGPADTIPAPPPSDDAFEDLLEPKIDAPGKGRRGG